MRMGRSITTLGLLACLLLLSSLPVEAARKSCAEQLEGLGQRFQKMQQELAKREADQEKKGVDKAEKEATKAEKERLGKVDALLKEAQAAAKAKEEAKCREKLKAAWELINK